MSCKHQWTIRTIQLLATRVVTSILLAHPELRLRNTKQPNWSLDEGLEPVLQTKILQGLCNSDGCVDTHRTTGLPSVLRWVEAHWAQWILNIEIGWNWCARVYVVQACRTQNSLQSYDFDRTVENFTSDPGNSGGGKAASHKHLVMLQYQMILVRLDTHNDIITCEKPICFQKWREKEINRAKLKENAQ